MNTTPFSFTPTFDNLGGKVFNAWWDYDNKAWEITYVEEGLTYTYGSKLSHDKMLYGLYSGLFVGLGGVIIPTQGEPK